MSKLKNIIVQVFVCIPISLLLSYCWIRVVYEILKKDMVLIILFAIAVIILSFFLCLIRGQGVLVGQRRRDHKYRNMYSVKNNWIYDHDKFVKLQLGEQTDQEVSQLAYDGYNGYLSWWTIFTILFAPILAFTQIIGLIFAFIASPKNSIYSSYTKLEYNDYKLPFLQNVLHFFFNFVLW